MTTSLQTTTHDADVDEQAAEAFAGRLFELFTGAALSYLIDVGHRTGLFAAATRGPATSTGQLPELHDVMDALWRPLFDELLGPELLPLAPGVTELLDAGGRAADVACGTGNAVFVTTGPRP